MKGKKVVVQKGCKKEEIKEVVYSLEVVIPLDGSYDIDDAIRATQEIGDAASGYGTIVKDLIEFKT